MADDVTRNNCGVVIWFSNNEMQYRYMLTSEHGALSDDGPRVHSPERNPMKDGITSHRET